VTETLLAFERIVDSKAASALVGTPVGVDLEASFRAPRPGDTIRVIDAETHATIGFVTTLPADLRAGLRHAVLGLKMTGSTGAARHGADMKQRGATFGYATKKPMAMREGCRITVTSRDNPDVASTLDAIADHLTHEFEDLNPEQAAHDRELVTGAILDDWRMGKDSLWTSGVINQSAVLPYHRDGNNVDTWSAMPVVRRGMDGGLLHLPEYDLVFPCGDGTVTWFYGKGLVHGVTPMRRRTEDAYRYSVVYYALQGMKDCATYAEETVRAATRRTDRERAEAARIRAEQGLGDEVDVVIDVPELAGA
jgi:hypothetical protein